MEAKQKNVRIAIISSSAPPLSSGGVSSAHYNLYCALKETGFNTILLTFEDNKKNNILEKEIKRYGTPIIILKIINIIFIFLNKFFLGSNSYQLKDIILSQFGCFRLSIELKKIKPDVIVIPDHGSPLLSINKPKKSKIILISHHNPMRFINEPLIGNFSTRDVIIASKIEHYTLQKVDLVICPSNYMKDFFKRSHNYMGKINVVPNIISEKVINQVPQYALHEKLNLQKNMSIIYIPSVDSVFKGSRYIFEIIRRLSTTYSNKIGFYLSGNISSLLLAELSTLSTHIYAPGQQSYFDNISCVKACTFCISPTLIENFGMSILEAGFCGLPVITFDVGGNADIIINGNNGFLVGLIDIEKLIEKANQLIENPELTKQMQNNSKKSVIERFGSGIILEKYKEIFKQLISPTEDSNERY